MDYCGARRSRRPPLLSYQLSSVIGFRSLTRSHPQIAPQPRMQATMNKAQGSKVAQRASGRAAAMPVLPRVQARRALRVLAQAVQAPTKVSKELTDKCVNAIRFLAIDAVNKAKSGHPGMPMGCAPMGYILWTEVMKYNPKDPQWFNRDRFVLSAGHGSMFLYAMLHLAGYDSVKVSPYPERWSRGGP